MTWYVFSSLQLYWISLLFNCQFSRLKIEFLAFPLTLKKEYFFQALTNIFDMWQSCNERVKGTIDSLHFRHSLVVNFHWCLNYNRVFLNYRFRWFAIHDFLLNFSLYDQVAAYPFPKRTMTPKMYQLVFPVHGKSHYLFSAKNNDFIELEVPRGVRCSKAVKLLD